MPARPKMSAERAAFLRRELERMRANMPTIESFRRRREERIAAVEAELAAADIEPELTAEQREDLRKLELGRELDRRTEAAYRTGARTGGRRGC
jgi:hypothetical protein